MKDKGKTQPAWRRISNWLHLCLGLSSGIIVFVVCLTGTLFVFHEEINDYNNREVRFVQVPVSGSKIAIDTILQNLKRTYPDIVASQYTEYSDKNKAVVFRAMNIGVPAYKSLCSVYADPYTGAILKVDHTYAFFRLLIGIHINLLLGNVGSHIVQIATVIFLFELISGLIWWWPKRWNKSTLTKSFKIKRNANWKRINLDLHNVLGFYVIPFALVLTVTALVISYAPVKEAVFKIAGGSGKEKPIYRLKHPVDSTKNQLPMEDLIAPWRPELQHLKQLTSTLPSSRTGAILVRLEKTATLLTFEGYQQFVNSYSGEKIPISDAVSKDDHLLNTTISLHIGAWWGIIGKILTFIVCLICTSLPITGFIIWYNKKFKKKKFKRLEYTTEALEAKNKN
ncbi:PepSY-associated TM helix domain-containing protein [Sphingobacterium sp. DR205]|uniref:PepSY-associated TM helix domain-containing protein n=1 Tax=Sphingobacterium sp. DR205 TaxID=2713573 RepID=UPI0019D101B9|nr:PepSY-associated TM helix domain-containing protein [Sphingobacterium sp. DR205]